MITRIELEWAYRTLVAQQGLGLCRLRQYDLNPEYHPPVRAGLASPAQDRRIHGQTARAREHPSSDAGTYRAALW